MQQRHWYLQAIERLTGKARQDFLTGEYYLSLQEYRRVMGRYYRLNQQSQNLILDELVADGLVRRVNKQIIVIVKQR